MVFIREKNKCEEMELWIVEEILKLEEKMDVMLKMKRRRKEDLKEEKKEIEVYREKIREVEEEVERGMIDMKSDKKERIEI